MNRYRLYLSGSEKRKKKEEKARKQGQLQQKLPRIENFFASGPTTSNVVPASAKTTESGAVDHNISDSADSPSTSQSVSENLSQSQPQQQRQFIPLDNDIGTWPEQITRLQRCDIVERGPVQINAEFPYNASKRRFNRVHYTRKMKNGEVINRPWLVYSDSKDSIYCFCCVLFETSDVPLRRGSNKWEGLSKQLRDHECGHAHQQCLEQWLTLRQRLLQDETIDKINLKQFTQEREFWKGVVERLIDIVIFLAERNVAFRGSNEVFGSVHNGNFLGLFELMAKRDYVLRELKSRIENKKTSITYLSKDIQNELIALVAKKVEDVNMNFVKSSKYYSIILDCTPDLSHKEQMTLILRFVHCTPCDGIEIKETFFGYLQVLDTTGKGLLESFMKKTESWKLKIDDCRGQSYDNGSNMRGKNAGFQARLLEINTRALYVPCSSHSLNLVIVDCAKSSTTAITFFGIMSRLYTIFSSSPARWSIFKSHVPMSVKQQSDTRWESRVDCVRTLRYHFADTVNALESLIEYAAGKRDGSTMSEAEALLKAISSWSFILTSIIWYDILFQINSTSKVLQKKSASLRVMRSELKAAEGFLIEYRESGFTGALITGREIAEPLHIAEVFPTTRTRKRKRQFDFESEDEPQSPEMKFRADVFYTLVDRSLTSIRERFTQISDFADVFGFLYTAQDLCKASENNSLQQSCQVFAEKTGDVDAQELHAECVRFVGVLKYVKNIVTAEDILHHLFKNDLQDCYGNLSIALRILLTVPVSVASAERSFSKLKLIKTFHRSTMTDERLTHLAMISIESDTAKSLDMTDLVKEFASSKTRKKTFF